MLLLVYIQRRCLKVQDLRSVLIDCILKAIRFYAESEASHKRLFNIFYYYYYTCLIFVKVTVYEWKYFSYSVL